MKHIAVLFTNMIYFDSFRFVGLPPHGFYTRNREGHCPSRFLLIFPSQFSFRLSICPDWMTGGLGSATSQDRGFFSSSFTAFSPRIQYAPFRQKDAKHPLPLPLGEVDERSEDGEGIPGCNTLSVTFGDSSPRGGAKAYTRNGAYRYRYAPFPAAAFIL